MNKEELEDLVGPDGLLNVDIAAGVAGMSADGGAAALALITSGAADQGRQGRGRGNKPPKKETPEDPPPEPEPQQPATVLDKAMEYRDKAAPRNSRAQLTRSRVVKGRAKLNAHFV